ncbi:MAG: DMT family transporter [Gammaproteobacteria bacterium]|nr:DMT family transporter [Gammaproteobacteria bacterium]
MDAHIVIIVALAAFFHAAWNATVKLGGNKILSLAGMQVALILLVIPLIPLVGLPHRDSWPYVGMSMVLHFGYYLSLAGAYRHGDFAQTYPVARGCAPILVTLCGVFVLGENFAPAEWAALGGIIGGVMLIAARRIGEVLQQRKALVSALCTACFIAAYTVADGIGGRLSLNIPAYMVWSSLFGGAPVVAYALHRCEWSEVRAFAPKWRVCFFAAALGLSAYWIVVWAMSKAPIPLVAALREISVVIAALIGAYYFKEKAGKRRIAASVIIFCSIALLGLAG